MENSQTKVNDEKVFGPIKELEEIFEQIPVYTQQELVEILYSSFRSRDYLS